MTHDQDDLRANVARKRHPARVAFVSTYPPTRCGLATFTHSLREAMVLGRGTEQGLDVVELRDDVAVMISKRPEVIIAMDPASRWWRRRAAERLSAYDVVILQHEYGIWGPEMGLPILDFTDLIDTPLITTLHTLLRDPTPSQQRIVETLGERSVFSVVPTRGAGDLLAARYAVDPASIAVIPHGTGQVHRSVARTREVPSWPTDAPRLLTWGLIGPGKGLEWAIEGIGVLKERYPRITYTIAGKTHPKVLQHEGESYRRMLEHIVDRLDLGDNVRFVDDYLDENVLYHLLVEASLVILPYESAEQIVSGVLAEAVAANVPVVATEFPHATELAARGAVASVSHHDPSALARVITSLLESPQNLLEMQRAQQAVARDLQWKSVALRYDELIDEAVSSAILDDASTASAS